MSTESLDEHRHLSTNEKLKLRQNERYDRNYRQWQQAKAESKQDHHKHLKQKVALQHDLIRAQDELSLQKREKEQQHISQKREAQKANRQAREEALLNICRQSLDDDRRSSLSGRQTRTSSKSSRGPEEQSPSLDTLLSSSKTLVTEQLRTASKAEPGIRLPYKRRSLSPFVVEDDEEETAERPDKARGDSLPWHHAQLYRLYGDKADYFLYPKIEPKPQKQLHPKLRNPGGGGAEMLWAGLRNESVTRLRRYDRNVSKELKSAFSAFVRQSLSKNKMLVKRNYCPTEDVPDLPRLLDQTLLHKACSLRHKLQLMHRSSKTNADRTKVLTYNNPFPDMNNLDGRDSIERYLPSWIDSNMEVSEPEYKRWLEGRLTDGQWHTSPRDGDMPAIQSEEEEQWTSRSNSHHQGYPKLKFLKYEDERGLLAAAHQVRSKGVQPGDKMEQQQQQQQTDAERNAEGKETTRKSTDEEPLASTPTEEMFTTKWEPLSMAALVEYTRRLETSGRGSFQHGQTKMWKTPLKA